MPDVGSLWPFETDDTFFDTRVLDRTDLRLSGTFCSVIRACDSVVCALKLVVCFMEWLDVKSFEAFELECCWLN